MKFFTSDTHFGHRLMINPVLMKEHVRPFLTTDEMDEHLIERWNSVISPTDEVYHLGDVGLNKASHLREILDRLHGKIYLIEGNHEHTAMDKKCIGRFEWVKSYHKLNLTIEEKETRLCLFHYPIGAWDKMHHGAWCLHGHSHGSYKMGFGKILDVGVDGPISKLTPLSLDDITGYMKTRELHVVDHHSPETGRE